MSVDHLSIIGLGLIGGSIALGAREKRLARRITAFDTDSEALRQAESAGAIDHSAHSLEEAVGGADLIILAVPVLSIAPLALKILHLASPGAIITDVGSTKGSIATTLEASPPSGATFIGGHPIAGTENSGFPAARGNLFEKAPFIITPTKKTPEEAVALLENFWAAMGCHIHKMAPEEHDRLFALISHLPHLVAYALVSTVLSAMEAGEVDKYSGGGFRDFTRIAASDAVMWRDICLDNRRQILRCLDHLTRELSFIREALAEGEGGILERIFAKARKLRRSS